MFANYAAQQATTTIHLAAKAHMGAGNGAANRFTKTKAQGGAHRWHKAVGADIRRSQRKTNAQDEFIYSTEKR
ncbi:MAG: hypothetical protein LBS63_02245 [Prevotellaceae bacterium]|jgi:hypothetical protein|nr:hypothetical protein [Prevotellaceae bacterium]